MLKRALRLKLAYRHVSDLFAALHRIAPEKRTAFRGRLQHFQKLRFPPGVNTGKGKAVEYGADSVLSLAVALELAQLGVPPDRSVRLLTENLTHIVVASRIASHWLGAANKEVMYLYLDPTALISLMDETAEEEVSETFFYGGWPVVRELMDRGGTGDLRRMALINLTQVMIQICQHLDDAPHSVTSDDFISGVQDWTLEELAGPDEVVDELASLSKSAEALRLKVIDGSHSQT